MLIQRCHVSASLLCLDNTQAVLIQHAETSTAIALIDLYFHFLFEDALFLQDPIGKQNASASFGAKFAPATPGLPAYFAKGGANSAVTQSASVLSYRCPPLASVTPSAYLSSCA